MGVGNTCDRYTRPVPVFHAHLLRRSCWLALFAMLAMALLPTVSHAFAASRGQTSWTEVCTAQGVRIVAIDNDGAASSESAPAPASKHLQSCPFCAPALGALGMPPAALYTPAPRPTAAKPAAQPAQARSEALAWRNAQPRAPPSLS